MLLSVAVLGGLLASCGSDETVTPIVQENNISDGTDKYTLSVHVYSSAEEAKAAGLDGAKVTISQEGDERTITVGADGIATFSGLRQGTVSWYATADGHITSNGSTNLSDSPQELTEYDSEQIYFERAQVTLARANGSIAGRFWFFDDDGDFTTGATKVTVTYPTSMEPNVFSTTTAADGTFSISGLPENVEGTCEGRITATEDRSYGGETVATQVDLRGSFDVETTGSTVNNYPAQQMTDED